LERVDSVIGDSIQSLDGGGVVEALETGRSSVADNLSVGVELHGHLFVLLLQGFHSQFERIVNVLKLLRFLPLPFARVVGGKTVTLHTLDAALLLLVGRLGSFAGRQAGLGFRKYLAP